MKILVCISKTPDTTAKIAFADNNTKFAADGVQWIINPYDEWYALVRAIELKEADASTVIHLITVGAADADPDRAHHSDIYVEDAAPGATMNAKAAAERLEVLAFVDSVRGLLAGDRTAMERSYLMQLQGASERWVLTLHPKDADIAALIQRITVTGTEAQIRTIEYQQADGDRSVLAIEPAKP